MDYQYHIFSPYRVCPLGAHVDHYMVEHTVVHAWPMTAGRFDIGSLDTYYEAIEKYGKD